MSELKNYTETMISQMLDDVLNKYQGVCKCDKCKLDIKAIALNSLPVRYVVTEKGELYTKIDGLSSQVQVDVLEAIVKAIEKVSKNPEHN